MKYRIILPIIVLALILFSHFVLGVGQEKSAPMNYGAPSGSVLDFKR